MSPPRRARSSLGNIGFRLGRPAIAAGRKSESFWSILGKFGIFSSVLRVPITFPPERFNGVLLSAMNVPDVKGSQGTYFYFTTDPKDKRALVSGQQCPFEPIEGGAKGELPGPQNTLVKDGGELRIPFSIITAKNGSGVAQLRLPDQTIELRQNEYTPWVSLVLQGGGGIHRQSDRALSSSRTSNRTSGFTSLQSRSTRSTRRCRFRIPCPTRFIWRSGKDLSPRSVSPRTLPG